MDFPILSAITFAPIVGVIVILLLPKDNRDAAKWTALGFSLISLILALILWNGFDSQATGMQFVETYTWFPIADPHQPITIGDIKLSGAQYHMGVDGISVPLVLLTAILMPLALVFSFSIKDRPKGYFALFLMLEMGMMGVFVSLDFVLFYVFWEVGLIPMYFLINQWGGENRRYASFKFFVYTLTGSIAMLLTIQAMYLATGTFNILEIARMGPFTGQYTLPFLPDAVNQVMPVIAFWAIFLAFAIKVPIWPFHTWLPDAHTEAPTAGSVILAGVLLKMGCYGFLRILLPVFPQMAQQFAPWIAVLALFSIVFGALAAMAQKDLKRLVAYSSVNHMGYVMLGIAAAAAVTAANTTDKAIAMNGAVLQMFNHGLSAAALFMLVGVIYDRAHTRKLDDFGGLGVVQPVYGGILLVSTLASLGLPGLNGFVSEFMVFRGAFPAFTIITVLATIGLVVTAVYLLLMVQRMILGPLNPRWKDLKDMDRRELISLAPLVVLMLSIGVYPAWVLTVTNQTILDLLSKL